VPSLEVNFDIVVTSLSGALLMIGVFANAAAPGHRILGSPHGRRIEAHEAPLTSSAAEA